MAVYVAVLGDEHVDILRKTLRVGCLARKTPRGRLPGDVGKALVVNGDGESRIIGLATEIGQRSELRAGGRRIGNRMGGRRQIQPYGRALLLETGIDGNRDMPFVDAVRAWRMLDNLAAVQLGNHVAEHIDGCQLGTVECHLERRGISVRAYRVDELQTVTLRVAVQVDAGKDVGVLDDRVAVDVREPERRVGAHGVVGLGIQRCSAGCLLRRAAALRVLRERATVVPAIEPVALGVRVAAAPRRATERSAAHEPQRHIQHALQVVDLLLAVVGATFDVLAHGQIDVLALNP